MCVCVCVWVCDTLGLPVCPLLVLSYVSVAPRKNLRMTSVSEWELPDSLEGALFSEVRLEYQYSLSRRRYALIRGLWRFLSQGSLCAQYGVPRIGALLSQM